ncbi:MULTISPECIES: site-specific integrase [Giesbergeria]|uniref:Site-specific integrase n=1 Tax=Giesbergeria sinuosa TaxID=80883 RepID=A0ABV9QC35_9BURK
MSSTHHHFPTGSAVFLQWLQAESSKPSRRLGSNPLGVYQDIWNAWLESLQSPTPDDWTSSPSPSLLPAVEWHQAQSEDVARFLRIRAGQRAHHQPDRQLSEVTRRRYWRVLDRVYAYAVQQGWLDTSPVTQLPRADRPKAVDQLGHCLPPVLWAQLPQHFPASHGLQGARDRAILLLLYELALAPEEVRTLTDDSLLDANRVPWHLMSESPPAALRIDGARKAQQRILALTPHLGTALADWLRYRHAHDPELAGLIFHSRKGGRPLSIRALFHVASKVIHEAHAAQSVAQQTYPLQRVGPQVMRNTAVVSWLRTGVAEAEVARRIGVDGVRALDHLRHQWMQPHTMSAP